VLGENNAMYERGSAAAAAPGMAPGARRPGRDLKLSFARLAAQAAPAQPAARPASRVLPAAARVPERGAVYAAAFRFLEQAFLAIHGGKGVALAPARAIVERMAVATAGPDPLFIAALHRDDRTRYPVQHGVNVAVYAVKMAQDLGLERANQIELGMCGLLHDIGMARIPEELIHRPGTLGEQDREVLKRRPAVAFDILKSAGPEAVAVAECAAQVCERLDGSGYPRGVRGDEIPESAKILGLLDLYEALVHSRPNRQRLSFFEAMKYIFKSCKTQFERRHMKSLLRVFTVFPVYSYVQLNSEAIGRVVDTSPDQPMRPKLQILFDAQRRKTLAERMVALADEPLLNIVRCVSEAEIADLLRGDATAVPPAEENCDTVQEPIL
jgi:HD-GYP domain-containing protein (c-di-GMP phosphodiesterase class II)